MPKEDSTIAVETAAQLFHVWYSCDIGSRKTRPGIGVGSGVGVGVGAVVGVGLTTGFGAGCRRAVAVAVGLIGEGDAIAVDGSFADVVVGAAGVVGLAAMRHAETARTAATSGPMPALGVLAR